MGNDELKIEQKNLKYSDGLIYEPNNKWTNDEGKLKPSVVIDNKNDASFEIEKINTDVENIYIDISNVKRKSYSDKKTVLKIWATDEANALYFALPERDVVRDVEKSKYISLNLSGKSEKLKVEIRSKNNERFIINDIKINAKYPMFFSFIRVFAVFLIILAVYIVRPKSPFYKYILNLRSVRQKAVLGVIILAHIFSFVGISLFNPNFVFIKYEHHLQYQQLTDAILDGHVYLNKKPSEALKNMDNPYDTGLRKKVLKEAGEKFLWDRAYYNEKYYVYFGIVPVLVFYLPYKIITGMDFPTFAGIVISACFLIFAVLGLVHQIIKRWFKNVPFITYVLLSFFFIDSCGIIYYLKRPDFYSLPIIMALMFSIAGLYFWISSLRYKKAALLENNSLDEIENINFEIYDEPDERETAYFEIYNNLEETGVANFKFFDEPEEMNKADFDFTDESEEMEFDILNEQTEGKSECLETDEDFKSVKNYKKIDADESDYENCCDKEVKFEGFIGWRLFIGSLCMAIVAGCRPQFLMGSLLSIPLLWKIVFKERMLFSKKSIKATILFILPYIIVAAGVMYYNYIRFDSVFDFGANYNLTTNDMTNRGFVFGRSSLGIFTYLFQPPAYSPRFPFISDVWFYTNYMGTTIHEYLFGGILFNHFLLCINLFILKFKNTLKIKGLYMFCLMSILFSVVIVIADTQLAGLLQRYMVDFSWLMFIPGIILILSLLERVNEYLKKHIYTVLLIGFAFSFYYDFATIFFYGDNALYTANPTIHYYAAHLIQFWL